LKYPNYSEFSAFEMNQQAKALNQNDTQNEK
jgi:hypothetical protein